MIRAVLPPLLLALATAASAQMSRHNSQAPIDVQADRIEVQDRANRAFFTGNVRAVQAGMTLTAPRVTVAYSGSAGTAGGGGGPQVQRIDATGGVHVVTDKQDARGDVAVYDLERRIITMLGGVVLRQDGNVVRGGRLVVDLDSGRSTLDGSATGGVGASGRGGRVTGRFIPPPQRRDDAAPR